MSRKSPQNLRSLTQFTRAMKNKFCGLPTFWQDPYTCAMCRPIQWLWFIAVCLICLGCSERNHVGGGYALVTPSTMGPDHHPGASLQRKGKVVWRNVYMGYFSGHQPAQFYYDGMFVFVGAVPGNTSWLSAQLFAVRGSGPPVLLSERLLGEEFATSNDSNPYEVDNIFPLQNGVRVQFTHSPGLVNHDTNSLTLSWALVRNLLDDADSSSRLVRNNLGDYRVLSLR
jgi:hypothetical protein